MSLVFLYISDVLETANRVLTVMSMILKIMAQVTQSGFAVVNRTDPTSFVGVSAELPSRASSYRCGPLSGL